jgi:hypothetical protein
MTRRDISVIYLFLEGELVGEAYCTDLFGQRMSIWEADALRKSDAAEAQEASLVSREPTRYATRLDNQDW